MNCYYGHTDLIKILFAAEGIPAKVPGGVHMALMNSGVIEDPFYRMNDKNYLWVGRTDWTFYTVFTGMD